MTTFPDIAVGQRLTADLLTSMLPDTVVKASATIRASTTAFSDDPDLTVAVLANATYFVEMYIRYVSLDIPKFATKWTVPSGATGNRTVTGPASGAAANDNISARIEVISFSSTATYGTRASVSSQTFALETAVVTVGSTAGSVALQWAQSVSNASNTALSAGSFIRSKRIA